MKWTYKKPEFGDMIRVSIGSLYHFGVYVSDEEVIQFGPPPSERLHLKDSEIEVTSTDIDAFLVGGFLEVCEFERKERKKNRKPKDAVEYARSKLGMRGYHILYNNCEHFANECVTGVQICRQAEDVRALFRKIPVVDVYIAALPKDAPIASLNCKARQKEIEAVSNEKVKREKYFVWKLLCYALERSFGLRGEKLSFVKESFGAWSVLGAEISLSHSEGALAVAVSRDSVGIDIELVREHRTSELASRMMNEEELFDLEKLPEIEKNTQFIKIWTAKEAIFKSKKKDSFDPKACDTKKESFKTDSITIEGKEYIWSVSSPTPERIRIFSGIDLSE